MLFELDSDVADVASDELYSEGAADIDMLLLWSELITGLFWFDDGDCCDVEADR